MANPTTNFNWQMPTSSDLVTDLPADFEVFGQAVDTALVDLKGGTTNQILAKNSNTDMDFKWVSDATGMTNPMTTTGDTIYSSSGSTPARLGIGTAGQVLTVAGGVPTWAAASAAADNYQLINAGGTATTGAATITISGISGKNDLMIYLVDVSAGASSSFTLRVNADSASNYYYVKFGQSSGSITTGGGNDTAWQLGTQGNATANKISIGEILMFGCNGAGIKTYQAVTDTNGTGDECGVYQGHYTGTSTVSSISLISSSGNFDGGTIYVYGA
jgi:hypothetical protein